MKYDVIIAGAGVIGGMIARELSRYNLSVCLLEKGNDVAIGASKANSGIIHGGYDPEPDTLKAKMNTQGVALLYEAANQLNVPHINNGSMICAFSKEEEPAIHSLYERGIINGISDMEILTGEEARMLEPALSKEITLVLRVKTAGIICPYKLTLAAVGNAMDNGVELRRNFEIVSVEKQDVFTVKSTNGETVQGEWFVNCAGCFSDKIAQMVGDNSFCIIPRSGEYLLLDKTQGKTVTHTIFQVPSNEGKGILVSPTADGNLLTGPTATKVENYDDSRVSDEGIKSVIRLAKKSVPDVDFSKVITSFAGVRSSEKNGDFIIAPSSACQGFINVAAIDSPGLTSCVAIARYTVNLLADLGLTLSKKNDWNPYRADAEEFHKMADEQKDEYIKKHPDFGKIVCRCEGITEGEIRMAIRQNPKALDMDGVKRRTRSGMGRCQGGFCSPFVMKLIAEENEMDILKVTKNGGKSNMLAGRL